MGTNCAKQWAIEESKRNGSNCKDMYAPQRKILLTVILTSFFCAACCWQLISSEMPFCSAQLKLY